jgi:hypothetical protein
MRLSLYQVKSVGHRLVTETGADFDESGYSRFKHGDGVLAERYGRELAALLLAASPEIVKRGEPIVIASAPYKYLPTASHELALQLCRVLNATLGEAGNPLAEIGALRMSRVDHHNYATHDVAYRRKLLRQAGLSADAAVFAERHVLLVDDARITGLAEETATELVMAANARTVTALYVVQIAEQLGASCPAVEHRINRAFVRDLSSLLQLYRSDRFILNIRVLKYVLGWHHHAELSAFFSRLTRAELHALLEAAWHTGPEFQQCYAEPLRLLRTVLGRDADV